MAPLDAYTPAASGGIAPPGTGQGIPASGTALRRSAPRAPERLFDDRHWQRRRLLIELLLLYAGSAAALFASRAPHLPAYWVLGIVFPLLVVAMLDARRSSQERIDGSVLDLAVQILGVISIASMAMIGLGATLGAPSPIGFSLRLWVFAAGYLGAGRLILHWFRREARIAGIVCTPTLIVGAGVIGVQVARRLEATPAYGLRPVGFIDADPLPPGLAHGRLPVLGGPGDLVSAIGDTGARRVILAFSSAPDSLLVDRIRECQRLGVTVSLVPRMFESVSQRSRLEHVGGVPLLSLDAVDPYGWQFAVKHAVDRVVSLLVLVALAPAILAIAVAVRWSSPGSVFFRQRRVGRDGHRFDLLKFRTMRQEIPAGSFVLSDGVAPGGVEGVDRRTGIGRFLRRTSLDELPQLINVLRGDMSLVGPRPERPEYVEHFVQDVERYGDRHRVKAGITGWAQVHGLRGQTSIADRVEWDNYYIRNWSLGLDLRILALTVGEILRLRS